MVLTLSRLFPRNLDSCMHGNPIKITIKQGRSPFVYHNIHFYLVIHHFISPTSYRLRRSRTRHHSPSMKKVERLCRLWAFQSKNRHKINTKNLCLLKNQQALAERNSHKVQDRKAKRERFTEWIGVQRKVDLVFLEVNDPVLETFYNSLKEIVIMLAVARRRARIRRFMRAAIICLLSQEISFCCLSLASINQCIKQCLFSKVEPNHRCLD